MSSGLAPGDPGFASLIEDLKRASREFRMWWPRHEVKGRLDGRKELVHPLVGHLVLEHTTFQVSEAPDLQVAVYLAAPELDTAEKIQRLLSDERLKV